MKTITIYEVISQSIDAFKINAFKDWLALFDKNAIISLPYSNIKIKGQDKVFEFFEKIRDIIYFQLSKDSTIFYNNNLVLVKIQQANSKDNIGLALFELTEKNRISKLELYVDSSLVFIHAHPDGTKIFEPSLAAYRNINEKNVIDILGGSKPHIPNTGYSCVCDCSSCDCSSCDCSSCDCSSCDCSSCDCSSCDCSSCDCSSCDCSSCDCSSCDCSSCDCSSCDCDCDTLDYKDYFDNIQDFINSINLNDIHGIYHTLHKNVVVYLKDKQEFIPAHEWIKKLIDESIIKINPDQQIYTNKNNFAFKIRMAKRGERKTYFNDGVFILGVNKSKKITKIYYFGTSLN